jgi:ankyrin repeat protein
MLNLGSSIGLLSVCVIIFVLSGCNPIGLGMQGDSDSLGMPDAVTIAGVEVKDKASLEEFSEESIRSKLKEVGPYTTFYWGLGNNSLQAIWLALEEIDVKTNGFGVSVKLGYNDEIIDVGPVGKYNDTSTLLHLAVQHNTVEVMKVLLAHDEIHVNQQDHEGNTPLHLATKVHNAEVIGCLLGHKQIDVNHKGKDGGTPLWWAINENNLEAIKLLLARADIAVNQGGTFDDTPLHRAVLHHDVEALNLLLAREDINVNPGDKYNTSPLYWAVRENNLKAIKLLLARVDIDVNKKNNAGEAALHYAVKVNTAKVIKLLLAHAATDVNTKNNAGNTALHYAVVDNDAKVINMLLGCEAIDLAQQNNVGETQLHIIAKKCSQNIIDEVIDILEEKLRLARVGRLGAIYEKFLLDIEARYSHYDRQGLKMLLAYADLNLNLSNHEGETCADLLRDRGMEAAASKLEGIGAKYLNYEQEDNNKNNN